MRDEHFEIHHRQIIRHCEIFLLVAAIIPLLGAALLIQSQSSSRGFMLTAIAAGVVGLLASFFAYRLIADTWNRFAEVLSNKTSVVPGESNFSDQA
jgi:FtsH-binding integral membrane protein